MKTDRLALSATAILVACSALIVPAPWVAPAEAAARSGVPPFCVKRGGPRGPDSVAQLCQFYDYQECLQAAAELRGNCVVNVDYRGEVSTTPAPTQTKPRRY
jgi:hypothetical protein